MLRIYEKDLTAASLSTALATNGLGALPHTLSCTRHQVINGDWSLTLSYPLDAPGAALLQPERLLCYEDEGGAQLYRISRLKPSISRQGRTLEVEAPHLCYDLAHKYIVNIETSEDDRYPDGIDAATALAQLLAGTGFSPGEVTVDGETLDYLDILQKDVMSCIKEQLLEKWGGELEFDNFTVHLRSALGQDRRYPIRDGRNIAGITVTEDYEPVVTRLHVRGYENANFEEINDGKDWIDSELSAQYAYAREGYADFDDVDDPQELLRLGRERLTALEVPEITYDIRLAQMRGTVPICGLQTPGELCPGGYRCAAFRGGGSGRDPPLLRAGDGLPVRTEQVSEAGKYRCKITDVHYRGSFRQRPPGPCAGFGGQRTGGENSRKTQPGTD